MNHMRGSFHAEHKLTESKQYQVLAWRIYEETDPRLGIIARVDGTDDWTTHVPELLERINKNQVVIHSPSKRQLTKADCLLSTQLDIMLERQLPKPGEEDVESIEALTEAATVST